MRKLVYTMQVRGRTSRPIGQFGSLRTTGCAASCGWSRFSPASSGTERAPNDGEPAYFDSELHVTGADEYEESGEISFGDNEVNVLRFTTAGRGHFHTGFEAGTFAGAASWVVDRGEGEFTGAHGFITSNFTITASGERHDFHYGVIFLPE